MKRVFTIKYQYTVLDTLSMIVKLIIYSYHVYCNVSIVLTISGGPIFDGKSGNCSLRPRKISLLNQMSQQQKSGWRKTMMDSSSSCICTSMRRWEKKILQQPLELQIFFNPKSVKKSSFSLAFYANFTLIHLLRLNLSIFYMIDNSNV